MGFADNESWRLEAQQAAALANRAQEAAAETLAQTVADTAPDVVDESEAEEAQNWVVSQFQALPPGCRNMRHTKMIIEAFYGVQGGGLHHFKAPFHHQTCALPLRFEFENCMFLLPRVGTP